MEDRKLAKLRLKPTSWWRKYPFAWSELMLDPG